jgi:hypothetical protein
MLRVLHQGTIGDLAEELYKIAAEDAESIHSYDRDGAEKVAQMMLEDRKGPQNAAILLHTIEKSLIEALILNTVGYQSQTDGNFRDKLYRLRDNCHGVYLITFTREGGPEVLGKGLSRDEWKAVKEMMTRYLDHKNSDKELVYRLETSIPGKRSEDDIKQDIEASHLHMDFQFDDVFLRKLESRMSKALDPSGTAKQLQALCWVGSGENLYDNMKGYFQDPSATSKPLALLQSCLEELKIPVEFKCMPILKTWLAEQYNLAKVLIILLTSSMFLDGGLNGEGPDDTISVKQEKNKARIALMDVVFHHRWTLDNLKETKLAVEEEQKMYSWIHDPPPDLQQRMDILLSDRDYVTTRISKCDLIKDVFELTTKEDVQVKEGPGLRELRPKVLDSHDKAMASNESDNNKAKSRALTSCLEEFNDMLENEEGLSQKLLSIHDKVLQWALEEGDKVASDESGSGKGKEKAWVSCKDVPRS